jgi:hypothetical protein
MLRKLATLALLVPLSLNGLWMICADAGPAQPSSAPASSQVSADAHCKFMCPAHKPAQTGAICVLTASADGSSIALFAVALATPPPPLVTWTIPSRFAKYPQRTASLYAEPALASITPPPEA